MGEVLELTPKEGHYFLFTKDRIVYEQRKHDFEVMRLQTFHLMRPHMSKNSTINSPAKLMPFIWDKSPIVEINKDRYTEEEFKKLEAKYLKR